MHSYYAFRFYSLRKISEFRVKWLPMKELIYEIKDKTQFYAISMHNIKLAKVIASVLLK